MVGFFFFMFNLVLIDYAYLKVLEVYFGELHWGYLLHILTIDV